MIERVEIITVRWKCGRHMHTSEQKAINCVNAYEIAMAKASASGSTVMERISERKRWSQSRMDEAVSLREKGLTYKAAGALMGITASSVRTWIHKYERKKNREEYFAGLQGAGT
jgi:hypothetical protein